MNVICEVVGLDRMQKRLDEISMGSARAMRLGCLHTAQRIERMAKILCPVRTGYLRSSIRSDVLGEDGAYASAGGSYKGTHGAMRDVEYAVYVNYGTGRYATGPGGSKMKNPNGGMQARPFFTNAVEHSMPFIYQDVQAEVDKLLHEETV
jgi:hypothetical protein